MRRSHYSFFRSSESLSEIVLSWDSLKEKTLSLLEENNFAEAIQYAGKAAVEFGAAGLMLYYRVMYSQLAMQARDGEIIQTSGFRLLTHLYLAKLLSEENNEAENLLEKMPEFQSNDPEFWDNEARSLCELAGIEGQEEWARNAAFSLMPVMYAQGPA